MNKRNLFVIVILFFCCLCFCVPNSQVVFAVENAPKYQFKVICGEKILNFSASQNLYAARSEVFRKLINKSGEIGVLKALDEFEMDSKEKVLYLFPEIKNLEENTKKLIEKQGEKPSVFVVKNICKIQTENGKPSVFLNEQKFYDEILSQIESGKQKIVVRAEVIEEKMQNIKQKFIQKGCFETSFESSSAERKNNIAVALSNFDGLILEPGETFSFNSVTGKRNAESGYEQAKIISGGTFVQGYGGGVCQVSTTIYNACLLAGLEIVEVHQHSLPVSYVEPGFDAMVNFASSDLVVRNNTEGKIIFATSSRNNKCKVKIFGLANEFMVVRSSKKTKIIPKSEEVIDEDYSKYQNLNLEIGEEKRISFAKDGFCTESYLDYYDNIGNFIKKTKIRENIYNPTVGLTVIRKN